jgi:CLIP-associating protein 1/2
MDSSAPVVVRESAALAIIAAQHVLRDEAQLFALLDGLPDEKKNLLTYLFDKNGVRGSARDADASKFEREMRRIDSRTSTPLRPQA